jgi:hypothetical protein
MAAWGAVFSMALCVVVLIASEFMPVSLLTLDRHKICTSAKDRQGKPSRSRRFFALVTSLLNTSLTGRETGSQESAAGGAQPADDRIRH